jgi:hypothetical protein
MFIRFGQSNACIEKAGHGFYFEEHKRVNSELVRFIG